MSGLDSEPLDSQTEALLHASSNLARLQAIAREARLEATEHAYFASFQARAATNQAHPDSDSANDSESDDWDAARSRAITYVANLRANPALAEARLQAWRPVLPTERILYGDEIVGQTGYTMSVIRRADIT